MNTLQEVNEELYACSLLFDAVQAEEIELDAQHKRDMQDRRERRTQIKRRNNAAKAAERELLGHVYR